VVPAAAVIRMKKPRMGGMMTKSAIAEKSNQKYKKKRARSRVVQQYYLLEKMALHLPTS